MKRLSHLVIPAVLLMALMLPGAALADGSKTWVEQSRPDGMATQCFAVENPPQEGDGRCRDGKCKSGKGHHEEAALRIYSTLTGASVEELRKTCEEGGFTIWKLAEKQGRLDALKEKLIAGHTAGLDAMVKSQVMTEQQKQRIIGRLKDELDRK